MKKLILLLFVPLLATAQYRMPNKATSFSWSLTGSFTVTDSIRFIQGSGISLLQVGNSLQIAATGGGSGGGILDSVYGGDGLSALYSSDSIVTLSANVKSGGGLAITTDSLEADSTQWPATDYDVSQKLNSTDTASLSDRINLKLTATDTASLSNRINLKQNYSDTLTWDATKTDLTAYPLTSSLRQGAYLSDTTKFALHATTITAGDGLSGGGDLSTNRTITANTKTGGGLTIITDSLAVDTLWNSKFASVTSNLGRFDTIGSKTNRTVVDTSMLKIRDSLIMYPSGNGQLGVTIKPSVDSTIWQLQGGGTTRNAGGFLNLVGNMYTGSAGAGAGGAQVYAVRNGRNSPNVELGQLDSATDLHHYGYRHASDGTVTLGSGGIVTYDNTLKSLFLGTFFGFIPDSSVFLGFCEDETNTYIRTGFYDITSGRSALMTMDTAGPGFLMRSAALITGTHPSFRITDDAVNKVTKGLAQSADTSAINFSFTNTGKPQMFVRGITGEPLFAIDSQYIGVGIATPTYQFHVRNTTASDISGALIDRTGLDISTVNRYRILELGTTLSDNTVTAGASFNGLECNPFFSGASTLSNLYGAFYSPRGTGASDTVTSLIGTAVWLRNTSTGTVGTGVGYDVLAPTNAGTWTTSIGVRIANQGLSGMTTSTGLQIAAQTGASNSYAMTTAGGNVGIGDASPASLLTVGNGDLFQVNSSGQVVKLNNITTEGPFGVPAIVDTVEKATQTASISATGLNGTTIAGSYDVSYYLSCTTANGTSTVTVTIDWDNGSKSVTSASVSMASVNNFAQGVISVRNVPVTASAIRYSTTVTGTIGSAQYLVSVNAKRVY